MGVKEQKDGLALAGRSEAILLQALQLVPEGSGIPLGACLKQDRQNVLDTYGLKRGNIHTNLIAKLGQTLGLLEEIDEMLPLPPVGGAAPAAVVAPFGGSDADEPEVIAATTLVPWTPVKKTKAASPAQDKTLQRRSSAGSPRGQESARQALQSISAWAWRRARGLCSIYASIFYIITGLGPAILINVALGAGLLLFLYALAQPYWVGEQLRETAYGVPSFLQEWWSMVWKGLRGQPVSADPCVYITKVYYNESEASAQVGYGPAHATTHQGTHTASLQTAPHHEIVHPPTPPDSQAPVQIMFTIMTALIGFLARGNLGGDAQSA